MIAYKQAGNTTRRIAQQQCFALRDFSVNLIHTELAMLSSNSYFSFGQVRPLPRYVSTSALFSVEKSTKACFVKTKQYWHCTHTQQRCYLSMKDKSSDNLAETENHDACCESTDTEEIPLLVYESPLGGVVTRLRTFSLMTAVCGIVGIPCIFAIKGVVPEFGMLAVALSFVSATSFSTVAVHFVFRPYIYNIQVIPIRKCSYKKAVTKPKEQTYSVESMAETIDGGTIGTKEMLLKATTRSLFLQQVDIIFDPERDVEAYKGWRPLANLQVKGEPLYVHTGE